jgi:hypothetical protein
MNQERLHLVLDRRKLEHDKINNSISKLIETHVFQMLMMMELHLVVLISSWSSTLVAKSKAI